MLAHLSVGSALVLSSLAALVPTPAVETSEALITPGPQIELVKKQNDLQYIGWVSFSGIWSSEKCDAGNTYYQAGGQWACCSTTRAGCLNMPIGCVNGNMIYRATATGSSSLTNSLITRACTSIWTASSDASFSICNTAFMFENDRDSSPKANIICGVSSLNWSYYRQQPAVATTGAGSSSRAATPLSAPASSTPTATPSIPTVVPPAGDDQKSESKAWIAGAVVGPIVGLALIGFGAFFFIRRKKNKSQNQHVAPATGSIPPAGATAYQQNSYNAASSQPPQYYPPMQQNAGAAPVGVTKQDNYYNPGPQSPVTSQGSQSPYAAPQQWQQPGGQPVYNAPSPSMSPQPQNVQPAPYIAPEARPFSTELPAETISVQPKK